MAGCGFRRFGDALTGQRIRVWQRVWLRTQTAQRRRSELGFQRRPLFRQRWRQRLGLWTRAAQRWRSRSLKLSFTAQRIA